MNDNQKSRTGEEPGSALSQAKVLRMMMILRVIIVTALLGSALYVQIFFGLTSDSLYFIIGITYLLTVFYSVLAIPFHSSRLFAFIQLLMDVVLASLLVLVTGAVDSAFVILYYVLVVSAAVTLGRFYSFSLATVAGILFISLGLAANSGLFDLSFLYPYSRPALNSLLYYLAVHVFALQLLAALSGYLAGMLQHTAARLRQRTADLESLRVLYENIVRSISGGIITTELEGKIIFINPAARELLQTPDYEVIGRNIRELLHYIPNGPDPILSEEGWSREMTLLQGGGQQISVGVSRTLLTGTDSGQVGKLYVIQDLREIKALQAQLRMKDKMATAGEMGAAIAHEIRNPLGAISGSAQMIRKAPDLPDDQRFLMDIIVRESQRLSKILNDFLTFARQPEYSPADVDLLNVARETVALLGNSQEVTAAHQIELTANGLESLVARVDSNMVRQMIYNLAANGVKAMAGGGKLIIALWREGAYALLEVKDSGIGISADRLERLFQPFFSYTPGGIGLGMAIVYRIVQEHGGSIMVKSLPGKGTSITVALPLSGGNPDNFSVNVEATEP